MKICPECNMGNTDASISCTACGCYLSNAETIDAVVMLEREFSEIERMERRKKHIGIALKAFAVCAGTALLAYAIWAAVIGRIPFIVLVFSLLYALPGSFFLLLPRNHRIWSSIFWLEVKWAIRYPGNVEPNDLFFFYYRRSGAVLVIGSVLFLLYWVFSSLW